MSKLHRKLFFLTLFTLIGYISLQIPFNKLAGSNVSFTLFDFFAPIAGAFLGSVLGIVSVLAVEVGNMFIKGSAWNLGSIIRLFPTLFAVYYFATIKNKNSKWILAVPVLSILAFIAHPEGQKIPQYTLFWIIPLFAYKFRNNLYIRSLGTTFTAHAVGGAAWIWAFNLKASVWQGLIPIVIAERLLFAAGIASSFIIVKYSLSFLASKKMLPKLENALS